MSVRIRITAAIALLTAVAMAGAGLLVYLIESARIDARPASEIDQEFAEFRDARQGGNDPRHRQPFPSVSDCSRLFIARNVPDDDEMLVG